MAQTKENNLYALLTWRGDNADSKHQRYLMDARTGQALTFAQNARAIDAWHLWFQLAGLRAGDRVAIMLPNGMTFAVLYLALMSHGVTVIPINPKAPWGEVERVLIKAQPVLLIADIDGVINDRSHRPVWRVDCRAGQVYPQGHYPELAPHLPQDDSRGAVLLFTSGTTGESKGVRLDIMRLLHTARSVAQHHRLGREDLGYSSLPLFHINAQVVGLLASLVAASTLAIDHSFHATDFWTIAASLDVTWINAVPAIIGILARQNQSAPDLYRLRFVRSASAPLPVPTLTAFEQRYGFPIVETYGMTEACSQITANPVPPGQRKPGSVGIPVGVRLQIVDESGSQNPPGVDGEVRIAGPSVIDGYLIGLPGTIPSFRDGWFYTGDHGHLDDDGYLYLTGRTRELINRGGQKVPPREVEDVLLTHPAVLDAAVIGVPDPIYGEQVQAYVVTGSIADANLIQDLHHLCAQHLSQYKRPVEIRAVAALPTGPTGKIQRLRLRSEVMAQVSGSRATL